MHYLLKTIKNNRTALVFLKCIVFFLLLTYIIWEMTREDWTKMDAFHLEYPIYLLISFLLIFVNQWCEWKKWKLTAIRLISDKRQMRKAFFSGITAGFVTPNGWGNFLGRMIYFRKRDRTFIIMSSIMSNASQMLATLIFGAIACWMTHRLQLYATISATVVATVISCFFFFSERLLPKRKSRFQWMRHFQLVQERLSQVRTRLAFWSLIRFQVFSLQYVLLFMSFGYTDFWWLLPHIWLIFLLTSFVPSLWSGKIIIRESAAIFVFVGSVIPVPDIVLVSLLIWVFNHLIPLLTALIIWLFGLNKKVHAIS